MPRPFNRTLKQVKKKGFKKTLSLMLAIALRSISNHLKYVPNEAVVSVNASKMLLEPKKGAIHKDLFVYKKREPICTEYLKSGRVLKEGDVVLDIGANIGYYALMESHLVGKSGRVYAIEPVSDNFKLLENNIRLNGMRNVSAHRFAFGETDRESRIYLSNKANLCAINQSAVGGKILGSEPVPMVTVDSFFKDKQPPRLIRMDVEGYEYEIIMGMQQTLRRDIEILAELHPKLLSDKLDKILDIMKKNNFKVRFVVFEEKVLENRVVRSLSKKAGNNLPVVASNITIDELQTLIVENDLAAPNVVFEKSG